MPATLSLDPVTARERTASVTAAISHLKGEQRVVLGLRYVDDLSPAAIGQVLQLSADRIDEILAETLGQIRAAAA